MGSKIHQRNIFESGFDSFEFDDGFLVRLDSDLKKNKFSKKQNENKFNSNTEHKTDCFLEKNKKKPLDIKTDYYDLSLLIEDIVESDFFNFSSDKNKKHTPKVTKVICQEDEKLKNESVCHFTSCLSPILGPKLTTTRLNLSSSTPVRPAADKVTSEGKLVKNFDFVYSEADLFDDWDLDEVTKETAATEKSKVTFSQAMKLIDEAKAELEKDEMESFNQSIDLLTGEVVDADVGVMFDESFGLPVPDGKKGDAESSDDSIIIVKESKPSAAHKLKVDTVEVNSAGVKKNESLGVFSGDDDDFDFLTQDLLDKTKDISKCAKVSFTKRDSVTPMKDCDLNDSMDGVVRFKKRRNLIVESDTAEDSPNPKFRRQTKTKTKKRRNFQENVGKEFIDSEAGVSDEVSSDEAEEEGEYERSFLDEESYCTQNNSANMTSKYLESVKAVTGARGFKIPSPKPYNPDNIFSQTPEENNNDYEMDSFCVKEVDEEMKSELSDLEVAEKILEIERKKRKRKRTEKGRKFR